LGITALGLLGCSAELDRYTADADTGSTHALVGVERSVALDNSEAARAGVLAGFVQVPADVDAKSLFELVGLSRALPEIGRCASAGQSRTTPSLSSIGHVEFLGAGDVSVATSDARTALAPHALPTVTELISGVVYTTRDRSAAPLPAGTRYALQTSGAEGIPALSIEREAPAELQDVTVGGVPLGEVVELRSSEPLDLTWSSGKSDDFVLVEISSAERSSVCTFRDDGVGSLPKDLAAPGSGRLSLHRVRVSEFSAPGVEVGRLRFDFEVAASVTFTE
jgi:hypothetical protein